MSILLVYYDLFGAVRFTVAIFVMMGIVTGWWLAFSLVNIFGCRPIQSAWIHDGIQQPQCVNTAVVYFANGVINVLTDVMILCLPVRVVWTMQLNTRSKLGLISIFLLGGLYVATPAKSFHTKPACD